MAGVAELKAVVSMDNRRYKAGANGVKKANAGVMKSIGSIASGLAAAFSVRAVLNFTNKVIQLGSKLSDLATQTGLEVETLQAFEFSAIKAGAAVEDVRTAVNKLSVNLGKAKDNQKTYIDLFERAGIAQEDIAGLGTEEAILKIAKTMGTAEAGTKEWGAALELIGTRSGAKLIEVLQELNNDGMNEFINKAKEAGVVIDRDVIAKLDEAADKMEIYKRLASGKGALFISNIIEDVQGFKRGRREGISPAEAKRRTAEEAEDAFYAALSVKNHQRIQSEKVARLKAADDLEQKEFDREVKRLEMLDKIEQKELAIAKKKADAQQAADIAALEFTENEEANEARVDKAIEDAKKGIRELQKGKDINPLGADLSGLERQGAAFGGESFQMQQIDKEIQIQQNIDDHVKELAAQVEAIRDELNSGLRNV